MTPTPSRRTSRRSSRTSLVALGVGLLGLALFLAARLGVGALPFDQHHVLSQFVGLALVFGALTQWR
jgi:hypothetical protein